MLDELKAVLDVALVADEQETASVNRFLRGGLSRADFAPEWNAASHDATVLSCRGAKGLLEVVARVGFARVCRKGTACLGAEVVGVFEVVFEVVVAERVCPERGIVFGGS